MKKIFFYFPSLPSCFSSETPVLENSSASNGLKSAQLLLHQPATIFGAEFLTKAVPVSQTGSASKKAVFPKSSSKIYRLLSGFITSYHLLSHKEKLKISQTVNSQHQNSNILREGILQLTIDHGQRTNNAEFLTKVVLTHSLGFGASLGTWSLGAWVFLKPYLPSQLGTHSPNEFAFELCRAFIQSIPSFRPKRRGAVRRNLRPWAQNRAAASDP